MQNGVESRFPASLKRGLTIAVGAILSSAFLAAGAAELESEMLPPSLVDMGDTRSCFMNLMEPTLNGEQVGRVDVMAVVTIGANGRAANVELPGLATMQMRSWAKARVQRWATCVAKAMRFEPAMQNGAPIESMAEMPLSTWTEVGRDQLQPRESIQAVLQSSPVEVEAAYSECATIEVAAEQRLLYQFSVDVDGRARDVRGLDSSVNRDINKVGRCIVDRLRFEPQAIDGKYARVPVHWVVILSPQRTN